VAGLDFAVFADQPLAEAVPPCLPQLPSVYLRGVEVHAVTEEQVVQHVIDSLERRQGGWIVTPNLDHLRRLAHDRRLRALYMHATVVVADGMPLVWASRIQGTPLPERVAGSDLISSLSGAAAAHRKSIFLLGGDPGTAEGAAGMLRRRYANVRISGTYCPPVGFQNDPAQMRKLIDILREADPDIVYVALGSPKQEWLIGELRGYLPRAWWLGIGISFSFLSGRVHRAPRWMQRTGLEWLHRLGQEPRRLAKRYLVDGLPFAADLLAHAAYNRIANRRAARCASSQPGASQSDGA
jgi:N-acetylglucosaminyldiphosphoundecaprenol N-acetyl-beta-D-mannosaminyltransferase